MTLYAVADIHGQLAMLEAALDRIEADGGAGAEVIFLGDYVDRGPDCRGVIRTLMQGQATGLRWTCLKGNHDRMFQRYLADGTLHDARIKSGLPWTDPRLGGLATLASYGVDARPDRESAALLAEAQAAVPAAHRDFLAGLPLFAERDASLFVHAGIAPGVPLAAQTEDDLVWIREPFLSDARAHPWLVIHGHTALDAPVHFGNRVDLDGGAGYGRPLTVAAIEGREVFVLTETGRSPLRPA